MAQISEEICPITVFSLLSPLSPCSLPIHLTLTIPSILILLLLIVPSLPLIRSSPYIPRDFCPEPVVPEWKRERTGRWWRFAWRVVCAGEVVIWVWRVASTARDLMEDGEGGEGARRGGEIVQVGYAVAILLIWMTNLLLPPRHTTPTTLTLLLTLPLTVPPFLTLIEIIHFLSSHSLPLVPFPVNRVFPSGGWGSLVALVGDAVFSWTLGGMVLRMRVGESEEMPLEWVISAGIDEVQRDVREGDEQGKWEGGGLGPLRGEDPETSGSSSAGSSSETDDLLASNRSPSRAYGTTTSNVPPTPRAQIQTRAYWNSLGYQGPSPELTTTIISSLRIGWMESLFRVGYHKDLQENDVWALAPSFRTKALSEAWAGLREGSVYRKLWEANAYDLTLVAIYAWLATAAKYAAPYTLKKILESIENPTPANRADAYLYAFIAFVATIAGAQLDAMTTWRSRRAGSRSKTALVAEIYKKALRRRDMSGAPASKEGGDGKPGDKGKSGKGKGKKTDDAFNADIGKIVNVISADANQVFQRLAGSAQIFQAPVELVVCTTFLYQMLGFSGFAGLVVFALVVPINSWLGKRGIAYTKAVMASKDRRMKIMNEMILGIKSIKLFGWQTRWQAKVRAAYQDEMNCLMRSRTNSLMYSAVWDLAPIAINLLAFASYLFIAKRELDVSTAFTAIALLGMLHRPLGTLPKTFLEVLQARVSVDRISAFLDEQEVPFAATREKPTERTAPGSNDQGLELINATLGWSSDKSLQVGTITDDGATVFRLRGISLKVAEGQVTVITGEVGSGKSALLIAMLGEMRLLVGTVHTPRSPSIRNGLRDSVAFCGQTPWIESGRLREIICFGTPMDQKRYDMTLAACCLQEDIAMFEDGDMTEIGIRGLNLSGGAKARVALARAVYSPARYLLLDDPWAAVDVIVGKRLLQNLLVDRILMEDRTIVVVTHHLDLLLSSNNIHSIVRMADGIITDVETPEQVVRRGEVTEGDIKHAVAIVTEAQTMDGPSPKARNHEFKKLVNAEERLFGSVKYSTYWLYVKASGAPVWVGILSTLVLQKAFTQFQRYWLKFWGEAYMAKETTALAVELLLGDSEVRGMQIPLPAADTHPGYYLGVFAVIALGASFLNLAQQYIAYTGSVRAVSYMHDNMLDAVVSSPARFFDEQPAGRILNRFSNDLQLIAGNLGTTLRSVLGLMGAAIANSITLTLIEPRVSVICLASMVLYYAITQWYLRTARDVRRIIAVARSPLFTSFGQIVDGILTVRAFGAEARLTEEMYKTVDWMQSSIYLWQASNRWLVLNFTTIGAVVILVVTMSVLTGARPTSGAAGIAMVTAQALVNNILWIARDWTNLEQAFNGVERVEEYLGNPREPPARIAATEPPPSWPAAGPRGKDAKRDFLVVDNLRVRYAQDLPDVIRGLSFSMRARERLAIVGRTASGKSTLAMSLLRFCEPSGGSVVLDGIDISTIGLEDLRLRISYLPQDPNLVSGSLRTNLDPFEEYADAALLDALDKTQLRSSINEGQHVDLDSEVVAGGTNWSQGQRQLICLARSIVRQSTLIISDEATSSIDPATDALVQAVIAENFKDTAFVTIAHRLMSIIRFDKVLVMAHGELIEMGDPWDLLQRDGHFRDMVAESGQEDDLRAAAKEAWQGRHAAM